ncbi:phosphotransferase [Rhodobacteraceae bacterium D3-12]|nr:phosphotransferase [Rhodobacteraceae bacterium D3-12]
MTDASPMSSTAGGLSQGAAGFLAAHGMAGVPLKGFAADASARRYFRLLGRDALLMDDGQDPEGFAAYLQISEHLAGLGLSAPRVLEARRADCLALIEDFGDDTYAQCLARGVDEGGLYRVAVEALLQLHHDPRGGKIERPVYDMDVHLDELSIFAHWFAPAVCTDVDVAGFDAQFRALWRKALSPVAERHETLVLRDFHVDNLMLLDQRQGAARCGLLDFQDAILGPCEYDLVSLLQDARRDLAAGLEHEMLDYYCANAPASLGGADAIRRRYRILGAQRHARILGVFVRLFQRDGKARYLGFLPRVLRQFQQALSDAGLSEIADFLDDALPGWAARAATFHNTLSPVSGSSMGYTND